LAKSTRYELGGLDRLKNCGHGAFEDLSMIHVVHLVLAILSVLYDDVMTTQCGVARAGPESDEKLVNPQGNLRLIGYACRQVRSA
jgi:hypothetical protein